MKSRKGRNRILAPPMGASSMAALSTVALLGHTRDMVTQVTPPSLLNCHSPFSSSASTTATPNSTSLTSTSLTPATSSLTSIPNDPMSSSAIGVRSKVMLESLGASLTGSVVTVMLTERSL